MNKIEIQHKLEGNYGKFFYEENDEVLAEMVYTIEDNDIMKITHTNVDPILSGKGVGTLLTKTAVEFARANGYKIVPLCPFAAAIISKTPEWHDVIK